MKTEQQKKKRQAKQKQVKKEKFDTKLTQSNFEKLVAKIYKLNKKLPHSLLSSGINEQIQAVRKEYQDRKSELLWEFKDKLQKMQNQVAQLSDEIARENEKKLNDFREISMMKEISILEEYIKDNNL